MAARVEVVHGPDLGWRFTVLAGEVRIGRGAGHQIKLSDPAWGEGHLRVQYRNGGYLVTNLMPYPVFLDGKPLAPSGQRTWYAGSGLQPTGDTLLRLEMVEPPSGPAPESGVLAEPPSRQSKKSNKTHEYIAVAVIALGLAVFGFKQLTKAEPITPAAYFTNTVGPKLAEGASRPGIAGERVEAVRRSVKMAVFRQSEGSLAEARERYLEAKNLILAVQQELGPRPDSVAAAALEEAYGFVCLQCDVLSRPSS